MSALELLAGWLLMVQLVGLVVLALAAALDLCARRCSAAARRGLWALAAVTLLALPVARLALPVPRLEVVSARPGLVILALACWLLGAARLLGRSLSGLLARRRVAAAARALTRPSWRASLAALQDPRGLPRVTLRACADEAVASPQVVGIARPVIVVPRRLLDAPAAQRRGILAHELAHVARADCLMLLLAGWARALYWINPLAWWALTCLKNHAEDAADDAVLGAGVPSSSYAAQLVALARQQLDRAGRLSAGGLRRRVQAILEVGRVRSPLSPARRWSAPRVIAAATLMAVTVTACEARSESTAPADATQQHRVTRSLVR